MQNQDISSYVQRARQALSERRFADAREIYRTILDIDPAQPRAWLALSALAQTDGHFREAVESVRSAADAWKKSGTQNFIAEVCMRLLVLGEYQRAVEIMLAADWSDPIVLKHSMGLIQYLGLVDAHEDALRMADFAIGRTRAPLVSLILARANALRHLGRTQEASDAYERCIAQDPLHAEAHWSLAQHQKSTPAGIRIPRIRKAIAHTAPDSEDAIYLHYALFKELDDAGDTEEAWQALEKGASLKRRTLHYNAAQEGTHYRQLQSICTAEFVSAGRQPATEKITHTPLFIVGLPRSGTTLLERILGNHPEVRSAGELNDFPLQFSWETDCFMSESIGQRPLEAGSGIDFAALGRGYLQRTAWRVHGARFLIDKLPNNFVHAGFIHRALPQAKIVCLRRNPMDSCFSTFKHLFSGNAYAYSYGLRDMAAHYGRFRMLQSHWERVMPEGMLTVDYEDLVSQPDASARRVADFCGIPFDPSMVGIEHNPAPSATASSSQIREEVHVRNVDSWKRYERQLQPLQQAISGT